MNAATVNLEAPTRDELVPEGNIAAVERPPAPLESSAEINADEGD